MNKNAIKNYAIWARKELIDKVKTKAFDYGISESNINESNTSANGRILSEKEIEQKKQLISKIKSNGYDQTIEEVAYTWFNRFIALRFMEVNGYLPTRYKIFSDTTPEIIKEAVHIDLKSVDKDKIYSYIENNDQEELYKHILISLCNELSSELPKMFTQFDDYTILLFPDNLLRNGSVLNRMVTDIPEEDWREQVQIIGWLYQYFNSEPKQRVDKQVKDSIKVSKDDLPAKTQLFTPDWIVRYMVENSLGRLWYEGHPSNIIDNWKYYLEEAEQEESVKVELDKIKQEHAKLKLEEIKFIDPCMGSGHILVYAFDVFMQLYQEQGYTNRDAVRSIIENNIYGLDIDERATQLAYFSVMMKAREYDSRFLTRGIQPHVFEIVETNAFDVDNINYFDEYGHIDLAYNLYKCFYDAKEYGSLILPDFTFEELDLLEKDLFELDSENIDDLAIQALLQDTVKMYSQLIAVCRTLITKYDVVVTNPPYLSSSDMNVKLSNYVKHKFLDAKADLFSSFINRCNLFTKKYSFSALVTMQNWMFLSSFEKFRKNILTNYTISNLLHMDNMVMGIAFGTAVVCMRNCVLSEFKGTYNQVLYKNISNDEPIEFPVRNNRFSQTAQSNFSKIPGSPVAYWVKKQFVESFMHEKISDVASPKSGMTTTDNDRFLRLWFEVMYHKIGFEYPDIKETVDIKYKWFPFCKGGDYRRWYGNYSFVVNWYNNGQEIRKAAEGATGGRLVNVDVALHKCLTWSKISSGLLSFRQKKEGIFFSDAAPGLFCDDEIEYYLLSLLNSKCANYVVNIINPTLNFVPGAIGSIPFKLEEKNILEEIALDNVNMSSNDWDSYETSWDFKEHPLIRWSKDLFDITAIDASLDYYYGYVPKSSCSLERCYLLWKGECNNQFKKLKSNEEELNRIFIDIYGLQDELTSEVKDKDVTVHCIYDTKEDVPESLKGSNYVLTKHDVVVSLISYAVGCMLGRYSLDKEGLAYAGGEWKDSFQVQPVYMWGEPTDKKAMMISTENEWREVTFQPDTDNVLPICDDDYFEDDIVSKFIEFIKVAYGEESLNANLEFIADALGNPGNTPKEVIRNYFVNDFFKDHCNTYSVTGSGKRPIYWLFDAGKKNSFKALIYMHRYDKDTIARIRTDYIHPTQRRIASMIEMKESSLDTLSKSDQIKANKEIKHLKEQEIELRQYEEKIHVLADERIDIDLDEGVKVNYAKFADVLAKIK